MATPKQQKILDISGVEFEEEILETDRLIVENKGDAQSWIKLFGANGFLKDILPGKKVDRMLSQKIPQVKSTANEGPADHRGRPKKTVKKTKAVKVKVVSAPTPAKKRGRPCKVLDITDKKVTKRSAKKTKRKYTMSDEQRELRRVRMKAVATAYWAKKKAETS